MMVGRVAAPPSEAPASEREPVVAETAEVDALPSFRTSLGDTGPALVPVVNPPRVTSLRLEDSSRDEAAGMISLGPTRTATLKQGERAAVALVLDPGACVAFVAQGGLGVIEVDLFLTTGEGPSERVLAYDSTTGPMAAIGARGKCISVAHDGVLAATLHVRARRGSGVVLVSGYSRRQP
jgi:hypothetical protein